MNGLLESQEPLKLSDEQLRIELNRDRDRLRNYSKCTGIPRRIAAMGKRNIFNFNGHHQIRDLEIILKPCNLEPFESSMVNQHFWLYFNSSHVHTISLNMCSNIILCALFDRKAYQDLDNTWHIPLYCPEQPYGIYITSYKSEHRLEWYESVSEHQGQKTNNYLCIEDLPLRQLSSDLWIPHHIYNTSVRFIMLMIQLETSTLLESVILDTNDGQIEVQLDRIWSIDFMEFKIYGIALDPQIQDYVHLAERITYYADHPQKITAFYNFGIKIKTYPPSVPVIRPIVLQPSTSFGLRIPNDPL